MVKVHWLHFSYTSCWALGDSLTGYNLLWNTCEVKKITITINCWFSSCGKSSNTWQNMGNQPFEGGCWLFKWNWGHSDSFLGSLERRVEHLTWLVRDLNKHCLIGHFIARTKVFMWSTFNSSCDYMSSCDCPSWFPLRGDQDLRLVLLLVPLQRQH